MQPSGSFQKGLIMVNAIFSGAFILMSVLIKWPNNFDPGAIVVALLSLGISLMVLLLDWLDAKYLPAGKKDEADKEAREWKNYLNKIKKELLSNKDSS